MLHDAPWYLMCDRKTDSRVLRGIVAHNTCYEANIVQQNTQMKNNVCFNLIENFEKVEHGGRIHTTSPHHYSSRSVD
ncbi:Hypothetical protein CUL131002_1713c [Corynebacterium ulcerans]|nr:Hypothetical protein CUL131002_1713c [Corynebacterium ulcerans]